MSDPRTERYMFEREHGNPMTGNPPERRTWSPYQRAARLLKAQRLAAHLHGHGITADEVGLIEPEQWERLAQVVGVHSPSPDTIEEVRRQLTDLAEAAQVNG